MPTNSTTPREPRTVAELYQSRLARLYALVSIAQFTLWYYDSHDPLSQVALASYFGPARGERRLAAGDVIIAVERVGADRPARCALFLLEELSNDSWKLNKIAASAAPAADDR